MANITRIKNNQITDSTITAAKLVSGTLTGGVFASDLTLNSNLTVTGNLSVIGNSTTINSVSTFVNDPLVVFNNGYTGSLTNYNIGILVNRNYGSLSNYGSVNTAWVWVENDQAFEAIATDTTGNAYVNLNNSGWANIKAGNITSVGTVTASAFVGPLSSTSGSFTTLQATNLSTGNAVITGGYISSLSNVNATAGAITTLVATNLSSGNAVITGGYAQNLANVFATAGQFTTLYAPALNATAGNITTLVATNFSTGNAVISGGYLTGLSNVYSTLATITNLSSGNAIITNASSTNFVATNLSSGNAVITGGYASGLANVTATIVDGATTNAGTVNTATLNATNGNITNASSTTLVATNFSTGNAVISGGYISAMANVNATVVNGTTTNAGTVNSATLNTTNGNITNGSATTLVATNLSSGNAVITGGYASGLANVTATIVNGATTNAGTVNTATLNATNGNVTNLSSTTAVATNLSTGNLIATNASSTTLVATNLSSGNLIATNFSGTTGVVTNFSSGNITGTFNGTIAGTVATANVSIYDQVTALTTNQTFYPMFSNTSATGNTISGVNSSITVNPSTGTLGATVFTGTTGNFTTENAGTVNTATLNATNGNVTNLSSTTAVATNLSTGNLIATAASSTTLVATNFSSGNARISGGYADNFPIGANTKATGAFTSLAATGAVTFNQGTDATSATSGTMVITGGAGISGNLWVGGNVYTNNLVSITQSQITVVDSLVYFQAPNPAGAYDYDQGFFSDMTIGNYQHTGVVRNHEDNQWYFFSNVKTEPAANVIAWNDAGIIYDRLYAGGLTLANTTASTSTTTGALKVSGGAGVAGNIALGGNLIVGGSIGTSGQVLQSTGTGVQWYTVPAGTNITNGTSNVTIASSGGIVTVGVADSNAAAFSATGVQVNGTLGVGGTTTLSTVTATNGTVTNLSSTTAVATNLSSGNAVITNGSATTLVATNFSSGNVIATNASSTTLVATNFSSGNAQITGGSISGVPVSATTLVATNFSTGNAVISGGYISSMANVNATVVNGTTTNAGTVNTATLNATNGNITNASSTTLVATNLSTGNAVITGAGSYIGTSGTPIANIYAGTGNFTTSNPTTLNAGTVNTATLNATNGNITNASSTTLVATNLSTGNAVITGGYASGLANVTATIVNGATTNAGTVNTATLNATNGNITNASSTTLVATNLSTGNLIATAASSTTLVATNFSSGNAVITGGSVNGSPIGASSASTGAFTTLTASGVTTLSGNLVAAATTASTSTTTGALVVKGGAGIAGDVKIGTSLEVNSGAYGNVTTTQYASVFGAGGGANPYSVMQVRSSDGVSGLGMQAYTGSATLYASTAINFITNATVRDRDVYSGGTVSTIFAANGAIINTTGIASTSTGTGALIVTGGAGIGGNLTAGQAAVFNSSQTAGYDFQVRGKNDSTLVWARPNATYDTVIVGNSAVAGTVVNGAKLLINSTDSIMLPAGTTAQRPGSIGYTDTAGMLRYSITRGAIEWYNGATWEAPTTAFTVITDEQFSGDGSQVNFTLGGSTTTASTVVSINGVLQIPTLAYTVTSGTTLTFTEAPASGDLIDVRRLTTTTTVVGLSSSTGWTSVNVDNDATGIVFTTGTSGAANVAIITPNGAFVNTNANVSVASANTPTTIDTMSNSLYRSAKYVVQVTNGASYQVSEALVITNGTTSTISEYGVVRTGANLGVLSATVSGGNTLVQFIAANATNNVRVQKNYNLI